MLAVTPPPDDRPPTGSRPPGLHALLRSSTAAAHARVEQSLELLRAPLQRARYTALLSAFHGFHRCWEPALADRLGDEAFTAPRRRLALVAADLEALGVARADIERLPGCTAAAALCDDADGALGSLYVVEGSTLGGRVIERALAGAAWCPPGGLRYFAAHGAATGVRWRETLARIERDAVDQRRVVAAALQTFGVLQRWLAPRRAHAEAGA